MGTVFACNVHCVKLDIYKIFIALKVTIHKGDLSVVKVL